MAERNWVARVVLRGKDELSGVIGSIQAKLAAVSAALLSLVGIKLFADSLSSAKDMETQLGKVQAKGAYTREEMARLREAAERLGQDFGIGGQKAAEGLEVLAAAGLSSSDAIKALPPVLALAKAETLGMEQAAFLLGDALAVLGLGYEQAGRAADVLIKGANISKTSAAELGAGLKVAGGEAKAAGLSLEQTVAILDQLAERGLRGAEAGTAVRNILAQLGDPASNARRELALLGDTSGNLNSALDTIVKAGGRGEAAIRAFGLESGPALRALLAGGSASIGTYVEQLLKAGGAADEVAKKMGANLTGAWERFTATLDRARRTLIEPLLEPLTKEVDAFTAQLRGFVTGGGLDEFRNALVQGFTKARDAVVAFFKGFDGRAVLDTTAATAGRLADALGTVALVARGTAGSIGALLGGIATTVLGVATAFFGLIAKVGEVKLALRELLHDAGLISDEQLAETRVKVAATIGVYEEFKNKTVSAADATRTALSLLGIQFAQTGEQGQKGAKQATEAVDELKAAADTIRAAFEASGAAAQEAAALQDELGQHSQSAADLTAQSAAAAKAEYERLRDSGTASIQEIIDAYTRYDRIIRTDTPAPSADGFAALRAAAQDELNDTVEAASVAFASVRDSGKASTTELKAAFEQYGQAVQGAWDKYRAAIGESAASTKQTAEQAAKAVADAFAQLGLKTQQQLDQAATNARASFDKIKDSGTASAEDIKRAWLAYAQAQIAASADSSAAKQAETRATLETQAAALGLGDAFAKLAGNREADTAAADRNAAANRDVADSAGTAGDALDRIAENTDKLAAGVTSYSSAFTDLRDAIAGLSAKAVALYDELNRDQAAPWLAELREQSSGSAEGLRAAAAAARALASESAHLMTPIGNIVAHAEQVKARFYEASAAVKEMEERLNSGSASAADLDRAAALARSSLDILDDQQLDGLRSAIDSARQKLEALRDSARNTVDSLRDELDQLDGDQAAIERRRAVKQQEELAEQLKAARAARDSQAIADLLEAGRLATEVHRKRMQQYEDERQAQSRRDTAGARTGTSDAGASVTPLPLQRIELKLPGGDTARVDATANSSAAFLRDLQRAGLRTVR